MHTDDADDVADGVGVHHLLLLLAYVFLLGRTNEVAGRRGRYIAS
jgi:hypothetical protein